MLFVHPTTGVWFTPINTVTYVYVRLAAQLDCLECISAQNLPQHNNSIDHLIIILSGCKEYPGFKLLRYYIYCFFLLQAWREITAGNFKLQNGKDTRVLYVAVTVRREIIFIARTWNKILISIPKLCNGFRDG